MSWPFCSGASTKAASSSSLRERVVERRDQRLHERDGAVDGAQVAPALERVRGRQVPVAALGRLVEVEAVMDAQRHLVERLGEVEVGGRVVDRVAARNHEHLDLAGPHLADERAQVRVSRRGGCLLGELRVDDRRAHGAQRLVDRVRDRVHGRRLRFAGDHERPRAGAPQVGGERRDPGVRDAALDRETERPRPARGRSPRSRAAQRQAVVGGSAGRRRRALDHVEPVHLAARRPSPCAARRTRAAAAGSPGAPSGSPTRG